MPALGFVENAGGLLGSPFTEGGFDAGDLRTARRMMPFQNAYYAAWLFDEAEKAIAEGANLKRVAERERRFRKRHDKF